MGNKTCVFVKNATKSKQEEKYSRQPQCHYEQLNTDQDLKGETVINGIFRKSKNVFGQQPADLLQNPTQWSEYGLSFEDIKRPKPEEFPAFQEKNEGKGGASVEVAGNNNNGSDDKVPSKTSKKSTKASAPNTASKSTLAPVHQKSKTSKSSDDKPSKDTNSKDKEKEAAKPTNSKDKEAKPPAAATPKAETKKEKRLSQNHDMDQCSLEEA